jgi:hypothetical protein
VSVANAGTDYGTADEELNRTFDEQFNTVPESEAMCRATVDFLCTMYNCDCGW